MEYLNGLSPQEEGQLNRHNFSLPHTVQEYPEDQQHALSRALMEAWVWLEREGLLVPKPGTDSGWVFISRRGQKLRTREDVNAYRRANRLPREQIHPRIVQKVWGSFLRGHYDTAVFQSLQGGGGSSQGSRGLHKHGVRDEPDAKGVQGERTSGGRRGPREPSSKQYPTSLQARSGATRIPVAIGT